MKQTHAPSVTTLMFVRARTALTSVQFPGPDPVYFLAFFRIVLTPPKVRIFAPFVDPSRPQLRNGV